jgi:hypothetical protein
LEVTQSHVLSGLIAKRAELAGKLEYHHATVRQLIVEIDAIDQSIRIFDPDIELSEIKPRPVPVRHAAYKGEVSRLILGALRDSKRPCTRHELAMHVMAERGLNTSDKQLVRSVSLRVGASLRHNRNKGLVRSAGGIGTRLAWEIS